MNISRDDLKWAGAKSSLSSEQLDSLWVALQERIQNVPRFTGIMVAYYLGALIVISAMGWFMTLRWEELGGSGIAAISAGYALAFILAGRHLWFQKGLSVPGGLLFTLAVCMTPLFVYGIEKATGLWIAGVPANYREYHLWVKGTWAAMEVGTILAALIALRWVRFPFLTAPIAFSLWYMSMDLAPLIFGKDSFTWEERKWVSLYFGLAVLVAAYVVDRVAKEDFAFWLYLFGLASFWGGLSSLHSESEVRKAIYCGINLVLLSAGVLLRRRAFAVFGGLGVFGYLSHLAYQVFKDSMAFPFVLSLLGIALIGVGLWIQKRKEALEAAVSRWIPAGVQALLPPSRE